MPRHEQTRLPLAPLVDAIGAANYRRTDRPNTATATARILDLTPRKVHTYAADGIPYFTADELAAHVGLHPVDVWPEWHAIEPYADGYRHPSTINPRDVFADLTEGA